MVRRGSHRHPERVHARIVLAVVRAEDRHQAQVVPDADAARAIDRPTGGAEHPHPVGQRGVQHERLTAIEDSVRVDHESRISDVGQRRWRRLAPVAAEARQRRGEPDERAGEA